MSSRRHQPEAGWQARIPADVDRPDTLLFGLTARQLAWLGGTGLLLWIGWLALHALLPAPALLIAGVMLGGAAFVVAVGRRDGITLDRWLAAAIAHRRAPRRQVAADTTRLAAAPGWVATDRPAGPLPGPLRLPARGIAADGTIDLGTDGACRIAAAGTVNFTLRTPTEQDALVGAFAAALNGLEMPVQILSRSHRADLHALAETIQQQAPCLPHPALEAAALAHARFLTEQAAGRDLRQRSVLVCVHADTGRQAATAIEQLTNSLAGCGIRLVALDGPAATAALADCADPYRPYQPDTAPSAAPGTPVRYAGPPLAEHSEPTEAGPHPGGPTDLDDLDDLGIDDADDLDGGDLGGAPGGGSPGRGVRDGNGMDEPDLDEEELW
jgi:hypothetical protein